MHEVIHHLIIFSGGREGSVTLAQTSGRRGERFWFLAVSSSSFTPQSLLKSSRHLTKKHVLDFSSSSPSPYYSWLSLPPSLEGECENTRSIHVGRSVARNWEVAPAARVGAALGRRRQVSFPPSRRDWRFLWIDKVNVGGCIESYKTHACSLISPP